LSFISLMLASIITSIIELFSKLLKIDDNLLIPITFAMFYNIFSKLFGI
jgi:dolichol kinase